MISASIRVAIIDRWDGFDKDWNYISYVLCDIAGKVYLLEKKL